MPHRTDLLNQLSQYTPTDKGEEQERQKIIAFIKENDNCFYRENLSGHIVANAWVTSDDCDKVLLMHHTKLDKWIQPGGHNDGDTSCLNVAQKELEEETGLTLSPRDGQIFDVDIHTIPEHKGVPEHTHYSVTYVFQGAANDADIAENHESKGVRWFTLDEARKITTDSCQHRMIDKTRKLA